MLVSIYTGNSNSKKRNKKKFRYFHVNFAFGIVEYVYNIDSLSTKQLNNFVVNTYTCNTRWRGVCELLQFFLSFFSGKQE